MWLADSRKEKLRVRDGGRGVTDAGEEVNGAFLIKEIY
jgi:hypothetical protein